MGKKGSWFSAVKKALSPESKEKKDKKTHSSKKKWFGKQKSLNADVSLVEAANSGPTPPTSSLEEVKLSEAENEQSKHAYSVAFATAVAAEAAVAAAQAAAEVVRLTTAAHYSAKSKEEVAAIKIQKAFRGYMARRALRALRRLVRLKSLIEGQSVIRQATTTLRCMQTLARVQSQVRARRIRMSEENQALQRQLQQKCEKEFEKFRLSIGENWNDSVQSKEQIEANLQSKQEAAMRRERALAYAYSHQQMWRNNSSKFANSTFMDPYNPHWGWSWLERWMAARPWESNSDHASVKSTRSNRAYSSRDLKLSRPPSRQSPSTPPSNAPPSSSIASKIRPPSPNGRGFLASDDSPSPSVHSERYRRHSIAGSSVRDDESLVSSFSVPSYMAPTESAKAKSRLEKANETPEKGSVGGSVKKRLSFPVSPAGQRRHSGPPQGG